MLFRGYSHGTLLRLEGNYQIAEQTTIYRVFLGRRSSQLGSALAAALTAASLVGANNFTYTVSFSANTGKYTITASSGDFHLTFNTSTDANRGIAKYLGYADGASAESVSSIGSSLNVVDQQRYAAVPTTHGLIVIARAPRVA